jgi:transcriptional regulator with XRE-family HTH domain
LITKEQIRDGRRLLNWSAEEFAKRAEISRRTIQRIENDADALEKTAYGAVLRMKAELEKGGIEFLADGTVKRRSAP